MNIHITPDSALPQADEDDEDRQITLYQRRKVGLSHKSRTLHSAIQKDNGFDYGFYHGNIIVEGATMAIQRTTCDTLVKILERSNNPSSLIQAILHKPR